MTFKGVTWNHPRGFDCLAAASAADVAETGTEVTWTKTSPQKFIDDVCEILPKSRTGNRVPEDAPSRLNQAHRHHVPGA